MATRRDLLGIATLLVSWVGAMGFRGHAEEAPEAPPGEADAKETVVLLHGMGRTRISLALLERRLRKQEFQTLNFPYSIQKSSIEEIVDDLHRFVQQRVSTSTYHFVGHSLGNVIVREGFKREYREGLGRIVMLAPPNQLPDLADKLGDNPVYKFITRDSGQKLGSPAFYRALPAPTVEFGVIAGDQGQRLTFDEPNDGIVTVADTRLEGMADHIVLHHTHTFIMNARDTAEECVHFLRYGCFRRGVLAHTSPTG